MEKHAQDFIDGKPVDIRDFLARYTDKDIIYCPNPGNGGDGFIAHAAFTLFDALSIRYGFMHFDEQVQGKTIFYGGGGNLIEGRYPHAHQFLTNNLGNGNSIVILPSTVKGFQEMLAQAPDLTILCRESVSYSSLRESGFPSAQLFLCDDLAFSIDPATLAVPQKGSGDGYFFRRDIESTGNQPIPDGNMDISMCWNGDLWDDPVFTEAVCRSIVLYINRFETIWTDRLHVAIMSAIYGKKVLFYPNDYFKNKAVYEQTLHRYPNVTFMEPEGQDTSVMNHEVDQPSPMQQSGGIETMPLSQDIPADPGLWNRLKERISRQLSFSAKT